MLFPRLSAFSALLFTLVFFASAHASVVPLARKNIELARSPSDAWTNAQRLAVGLPPLAPRRLKRAPTPTEPGVAKRAAPSPSPSSNAFSSTRVYVLLFLAPSSSAPASSTFNSSVALPHVVRRRPTPAHFKHALSRTTQRLALCGCLRPACESTVLPGLARTMLI